MDDLDANLSREIYACEYCDHTSSYLSVYNRHLMTRKHQECVNRVKIAANEQAQKMQTQTNNNVAYEKSELLREIEMDDSLDKCVNSKPSTFICSICEYSTYRKLDLERHNLSDRHLAREREKQQEIGFQCKLCSRTYANSSSLGKHKKLCSGSSSKQNDKKDLPADNQVLTSLVDIINKKDERLNAIVMELLKSMPTAQTNMTINSNNNVTNNTMNNNSFNLNFFLNETCKDALNMSDFIKSIQVGFEDIERIGNIGYVDGLAGIIIKSLQELGVEKRPIHCTDAKRQTLYIKENNEWTKEDANWSHLQHMVNEVQKINLRQLPAWREQHPNCLTSSSKYTTTYNTMSQELMGGECKKVKLQVKDNKIMNKIMKEVIIDKSLFLGEK